MVLNSSFMPLLASVAALSAEPVAPGKQDLSPGGEVVAEAVHSSLVPSHEFATWVLKWIDKLIAALGLHHSTTMEQIIYTLIVLAVAIGIGFVVRYVAIAIARKVMDMKKATPDYKQLVITTFRKCSHIIPPIVFLALIPFAFSSNHTSLDWILRGVGVYGLITLGIGICALLQFAWVRFDERANRDNHPLKGVLNIGRGIVWIIIVIISISILINRSPMSLLAGLGAFAAALMLIFKDSILGFVAGIQLSQNDMLRVGDWIVVPSTIANGIVVDVTLSVVKVQNWDNTMVMLPPYTLVSGSFQNWRNMFAVGYRMIDRTLYIDNSTVVSADDTLIQTIAEKYPVVREFIESRQKARAESSVAPIYNQVYNNSSSINGTIDTNLGLFRAYITAYLIAHPQIETQNNMDLILTQKQASPFGVELQIECYSKMTGWAQFEALQSEVLEHFHAVSHDFKLKIYNAPDSNTFNLKTDIGHPLEGSANAPTAPAPGTPVSRP